MTLEQLFLLDGYSQYMDDTDVQENFDLVLSSQLIRNPNIFGIENYFPVIALMSVIKLPGFCNLEVG